MTSCNPLLHLEDAIGEISRKRPGSPRTEIMLTRLHFYVQLQLGAWFESSLKPYGLNHSAWLALMLIYSRPQERVSPSDISATLAFSRTNATRVVDELEGRGWIQRHPCPDDRRKTELGLTEAGYQLIREVMPVHRQRMRDAWQDFTPEEQTQFIALQRKLLTRLETGS